MIKKIMITVALIVFLLFIQSYVFSESCPIVSPSGLTTVDLGCYNDDCYFTVFNSSDIINNSAFIDAQNTCKNNYISGDNYITYNEYRSCIEEAISTNITSPTKIISYSDLTFIKGSSCNKNLNLILDTNLNFEMIDNTTSITFSGVDTLNTNNHNVDVFINNNNKLGNAIFNLNIPIVNISENSLFEIRTKERNSCATSGDDYSREGIIFNFKNIVVLENSKLDLNISIKKSLCSPLLDAPLYGLYGGELFFDGNSITNNGILNLNLKSQDSQNGRSFGNGVGDCFDGVSSYGGISRTAGNVLFNLNYFNNNSTSNLKIVSGNGGLGGNGADAPRDCKRDPPGNGGAGGTGGDIFFYIDKINNFNNFDLNLIAGNGGKGGNTGFDGGGNPSSDYAIGGNSGDGGNIYFCKSEWDPLLGYVCNNNFNKINQINNSGVLNISGLTGIGNNGGNKNNHPNDGRAGDGGDGGSFKSNFAVDLLNNSNIFNINLESNVFGFKGIGSGGSNGVSGVTTNIIIDYLINKSEHFNVILNSKKEINQNSSDLIISNLETGSYLPSKVYTISNLSTYTGPSQSCIDDCSDLYCTTTSIDCDVECSGCGDPNTCDECLRDCQSDPFDTICTDDYDICIATTCDNSNNIEGDTTNRAINIINACYVKEPSNIIYYVTGAINIKSANQEDIFNYLPTTTSYTDNVECSLCDYYDLADDIMPTFTINKFSKIYTLYSNVSGTINVSDLNIYYAKNNINFPKLNNFNPFLKQTLPLYTIKNNINGEFNDKLNLYEYKLELSNLKWYYNPLMSLTEKDIYCYYQNYRITGKITSNNGNKNFDFPFTPIFK